MLITGQQFDFNYCTLFAILCTDDVSPSYTRALLHSWCSGQSQS